MALVVIAHSVEEGTPDFAIVATPTGVTAVAANPENTSAVNDIVQAHVELVPQKPTTEATWLELGLYGMGQYDYSEVIAVPAEKDPTQFATEMLAQAASVPYSRQDTLALAQNAFSQTQEVYPEWPNKESADADIMYKETAAGVVVPDDLHNFVPAWNEALVCAFCDRTANHPLHN